MTWTNSNNNSKNNDKNNKNNDKNNKNNDKNNNNNNINEKIASNLLVVQYLEHQIAFAMNPDLSKRENDKLLCSNFVSPYKLVPL